ncbi:cytochrome b/b6 domain-containing protein [Thermopetrobacter sp. TC1]|uniref:cytochrome b/b6 domain-containing protein n=1 Tax=Thermopetrobacter sp. TC1 TaxID=1495045 RepID=UPI00069047E5|nr:cytochrome b/b6 domain-containing protein [Thermopetrobacter sp. TC1]
MVEKTPNITNAEGEKTYLAKVQIFTLYERFWHWTQAALIILLLLTGFTIHGAITLFSFKTAHTLHVLAAVALMILWIFTIFWQFTTGTWRHFVPLLEEAEEAPTFAQAVRGWLTMIVKIARYYAWGILRGEQHPYKKTLRRKHNPLQALAYFGLMAFIGPVLWISGIAYLTYDFWQAAVSSSGSWLKVIAFLHTMGAWLMLVFVLGHAYMATLGKTPLYLIKAMITGVEDIVITETERRWLQTHYPQRLIRVEEVLQPAS